ncbi:MAG: GNAT family N-acetyltransferase [Acidobacteria bacterium]|nr:GNAT family N-acetyltransferase [Acidobacteriota bacterium]MBI3662627.1 GNAT family N-acetyltransferase [Acidobacteriota bacterium]
MHEIVHAATPGHIATVRELFLEYQRWLGLDLCFQNFSLELAALPGDYAPPSGRLLLVLHDARPAGCIALRKLTPEMDVCGGRPSNRPDSVAEDETLCEMKRLFVRPEFQSLKIGRALAERVIAEARAIGYTHMRLDTLPVMTRARALYAALGFREIPPYRHNPVPGAIYMELDLCAAAL